MNAPIIQGSPEWFAMRIGKATGSRIKDIIAKTKTGYSTSRANYAAQLVAERLTGKVEESFANAAMKWGTECEPLARASYEAETGVMVDEVGMLEHPAIAMTGASPDGLVGSDGMVEIKCPNTATHIATMLSGKADPQYMSQMQWQMVCANRAWCDFVSFDPRMPADMQLFIVRVPRDDVLIAEYEKEVISFLGEVDATVSKLIALRRGK